MIAQGTNVDGVCVFEEATAILVHGSGTARTAVSDSCALELLSVDLGQLIGSGGVGTPGARPKVWEQESVASPASAGVVADALAEVAASTTSTSYTATVGQTIYDGTGTWMYDDFVIVEYVQRKSDGRISGAAPVAGACGANSGTITTQEVRACWFKMPHAGPTVLEFKSGGTYRQTVLALTETDRRNISEHFVVTTAGDPIGSCDPGGAMPPGWSSYCNINVS